MSGAPEPLTEGQRWVLLNEADRFITQTRLRLQLLADGWASFEEVPVRPRRTKVTMDLDADLVAWFRLLGPGWHGRIEDVLRVFMLTVQSKVIRTSADYDWRGRRLDGGRP